MERNRRSYMKKLFSFLLLIILISSLLFTAGCSCSGTSDPDQPGQNNSSMSWQDNYDLGIRLLAEGNYEEAILAFQAAIQIDPKRAENYIYLADAYIGAGDYDAAMNVLTQGREQIGSNPAFDRLQENLDFLQSNTVGIRITNFHFDQARFPSGQKTEFMVSVVYRCPDNVDCVLMIGTNIHEPYSYAMMDKDWPVSGGGTYSFYISDTPVFWEESPYAIYVNMSEADHGDSWTPLASDILYIDAEGNVTSDFGPIYDDPHNDWDDPYNEAEHPLATLFAADPEAGLTIDELTLFGTPIKGLSYDDACTIATANDFPRYKHSQPEDNHFGLYQGEYDPILHLYPGTSTSSSLLGSIFYNHYLTTDDNGNAVRDPEETPIWIGIRNIHTYDTLEQVLSNLGYTNSYEIATYIQDMLLLPADEARPLLNKLWEWGWCCNANSFSSSGETGLLVDWGFTWYGSDPETDLTYSVFFEFDVAADCLTNIHVSVY